VSVFLLVSAVLAQVHLVNGFGSGVVDLSGAGSHRDAEPIVVNQFNQAKTLFV
jgi:hypothetical protein